MGIGRQGKYSRALLMGVRCVIRTLPSAVNDDKHCGQMR